MTDHTRLEAAECIRELIEEIRLVPENGKLRVELYGELAALINLANEHPRSKGTGVQVTLVAGTGFVQERTRWELRDPSKIGGVATPAFNDRRDSLKTRPKECPFSR